MILVFHASLAPRGYGRTSPRPPRVFLPFLANLARVVAFRHPYPRTERRPAAWPRARNHDVPNRADRPRHAATRDLGPQHRCERHP